MGDQFALNPYDPAFLANPYPFYRPLLEQPPIVIRMRSPTALIARYHDAKAVLSDPARFSSRRSDIDAIKEIDPLGDAPTMLTSDPPVHTRLRRLVLRDFSPRRVQELALRVHALVGALLDRTGAGGAIEIMGELANPLPQLIISEMLGIPPDHQRFKGWCDAIAENATVLPGMPLPESARLATADLRGFFEAEVTRRRHNPGSDLISALVAAQEQGEALNAVELIPFLVLLLMAANETTTNLIGSGMLALCRHPEQLERLRREQALMTSALEEMLRFDGPVQATVRLSTEESEIAGTIIPKNSVVMVALGAANRDPAQFPSPDTFDIARQPNDHLGFGEGIHFCIGAALARLQASAAIGAVIERFPRLRLAEEPLSYKSSIFVRGLSRLRLLTS